MTTIRFFLRTPGILMPHCKTSRLPLILFMLAMMLCVPMSYAAEQPRTLEWEDLVPEGWNPNALFDQYSDDEFAAMSDEKYFKLQEKMLAMFESAPTVDALDGETVQIPGFMLPLEFEETMIKEFLLVPYYGACVHTPPPPANQVIHGKLQSDFTMNTLFEPVWISGKLRTIRTKTNLGESGVSQTLSVDTGYTMEVDEVRPYQADS
ncbi:MAG: DUF3299 domain-containing protein [Gammaproteobacteria bacterium]|nr:DUF3299 domain-containing protein [Gammaproteobacteria bacterium]